MATSTAPTGVAGSDTGIPLQNLNLPISGAVPPGASAASTRPQPGAQGQSSQPLSGSTVTTPAKSSKSRLVQIITISGWIVGIVALVLAAVALWPGFSSTEYGKKAFELARWTAAKDYRHECKDMLESGIQTTECEAITSSVLPPPPFLDIAPVKRALRRLTSDSIESFHSVILGNRVVDGASRFPFWSETISALLTLAFVVSLGLFLLTPLEIFSIIACITVLSSLQALAQDSLGTMVHSLVLTTLAIFILVIFVPLTRSYWWGKWAVPMVSALLWSMDSIMTVGLRQWESSLSNSITNLAKFVAYFALYILSLYAIKNLETKKHLPETWAICGIGLVSALLLSADTIVSLIGNGFSQWASGLSLLTFNLGRLIACTVMGTLVLDALDWIVRKKRLQASGVNTTSTSPQIVPRQDQLDRII